MNLLLRGSLVVVIFVVVAANLSETCDVDPIVVQSVFAVDTAESTKKNATDPKQIIRNRQIFVLDVRSFLSGFQSRYNVTDVNAVVAFGEGVTVLEDFNAKEGGSIDFGDVMTDSPNVTSLEALEEIAALLGKLPAPKKSDYVRMGILVSDHRVEEKDEVALDAVLKRLAGMNVVLFAVGDPLLEAQLTRIAGSEDRTFLVDLERVDTVFDIKEKFQTALCRGIEENRIFVALTIGAGSIAAIVVAVILFAVAVYVGKEVGYKRWQLSQLAAAEKAMKKSGDDVNPMYKDPVTTTSPEEMGVNMERV